MHIACKEQSRLVFALQDDINRVIKDFGVTLFLQIIYGCVRDSNLSLLAKEESLLVED
jgi:hypothetical protein